MAFFTLVLLSMARVAEEYFCEKLVSGLKFQIEKLICNKSMAVFEASQQTKEFWRCGMLASKCLPQKVERFSGPRISSDSTMYNNGHLEYNLRSAI